MIDPQAKSVSPNSFAEACTVAAVVLGAVFIVAFSLPGTAVPGGSTMMTHYMALLGNNQPWNVVMFMGVPVVLAETTAVSELRVLFEQGEVPKWVAFLNRWSGILLGPYFFGIFTYLMKNAVTPLTLGGAWNGVADVVAVGSYLSSVFPLVGVFLIEVGVLGRSSSRQKMLLHAIFVGIFLIVVHIAMIFGMFDPVVFGWCPPNDHACMGMEM